VIYSIPADIAATFECESRLSSEGAKPAARTYGQFFGSVFVIGGRTNLPVALLWAQEDGYWKIASWKVGFETRPALVPPVTDVKLRHVPADSQLVSTVHRFLEAWMIKKDYDAAFGFISKKCYACYDLERDPAQPASTSPDDAGQKIRAGLQRTGDQVGKIASLDAVLSGVQPTHPAARIADHPHSTTFTLTSIPIALANAAECDARKSGRIVIPDPLPLEYGDAYLLLFRLRTESGEGPVLRTLWHREDGAWRIMSYDVESP
jgi:hypothetical protein